MAESLQLALAGEAVHLLADRALYWPARRRLLLADLHLGKGDTFRAAGIAVPSGGTAHDFARIEALLAWTQAASLWILGDFLHARRHRAVDTAWRVFRDRHARVEVAVVPGNHDRAFDADAAGVGLVRAGTVEGPFAFQHLPAEDADPAVHTLCGHLHPVLRLPGAGRHPLFWLRERMTVLPAFSAFTGGHAVARADARGSVLCDGQALLQLP